MPKQPSHPTAPTLGHDGRILEGVVTTKNADGSVNISPMGPVVDASMTSLALRPYRTSTTYENLKRTGEGVFHVTDDAELLAQTAIGDPEPLPRLEPAAAVDGVIISDACRWYAFRVTSIDDADDRTHIDARVIDRGTIREFFGWNRAMHAVLEAAILATRVEFLEPRRLLEQLEPLSLIIDKTGGAAEHRALALLEKYIASHISHPPY